jgi:hypothetical protein
MDAQRVTVCIFLLQCSENDNQFVEAAIKAFKIIYSRQCLPVISLRHGGGRSYSRDLQWQEAICGRRKNFMRFHIFNNKQSAQSSSVVDR